MNSTQQAVCDLNDVTQGRNIFAILLAPGSDKPHRTLLTECTLREIKLAGPTLVRVRPKGIWDILLRTSLTINDIGNLFMQYDKGEFYIFEISEDNLQMIIKTL